MTGVAVVRFTTAILDRVGRSGYRCAKGEEILVTTLWGRPPTYSGGAP
jgi:hypothetical protein